MFDRFQKDYGFGKPDFVLYKPKGCDTCGGSGYKGRVGLHELLVGTDPVKKLIQEHARVAEMLRAGALGRHAHPEDGRHGEGAPGRSPTWRRCGRSASSDAADAGQAHARPDGIRPPHAGADLQRSLETPLPLQARVPQRDRHRALPGARHQPRCSRRSSSRRRTSRAPTAARSTGWSSDKLQFEIVRNDSLSIAMGGTSGNPVPFYPDPAARQGRQAQLHDDRGLRGAARTAR